MKVSAFAITLLLSGAAIAQTTTTHSGHSGTSTDVSAQTGTTGTDVDVSAQTGTTGVQADVDVNAQTTTTQPSTSWSTTTQSNTSTSWNSGQTGTTMASNMTGQMVAPSNANPERDARGIRVISDPAMAPAGYNGSAGTGMGGPVSDTGASMAADASYRACSATVTDNCVQTYERGRSPR